MADISEEELQKEIEKILEKADLGTTSAKAVRQQLEKKLGVNLSSSRSLIDQLVMDYVNSKESDEDEEVSLSEEEEEEKKPPKRLAPPPKAAPKKAKKTKKESSEEEEEEDEEDGSNESSEEDKKKKSTPKKKGGRKKKGSDADSDSDWGRKKEKAAKAKKAGGARGKRGGYTRAYKLSPELSELMGEEEMPRHEVVKRVWAIIKEKQLYDPNNKQFAICDDALYKVFGTKRFRTFGMMKYLKTHFLDE